MPNEFVFADLECSEIRDDGCVVFRSHRWGNEEFSSFSEAVAFPHPNGTFVVPKDSIKHSLWENN